MQFQHNRAGTAWSGHGGDSREVGGFLLAWPKMFETANAPRYSLKSWRHQGVSSVTDIYCAIW
jgi:hypothetical protein